MRISVRTRCLLSLALALSACATDSSSELALATNEPGHVAGTFARDGLEIAFDLTPERLELRGTGGTHMITQTVRDGLVSLDVLDGRLRATGADNAPDPVLDGDPAVLAELHALPEAALADALPEELAAAGVDLEALAPIEPEHQNIYDGGDGYFYFAPDESKWWLSVSGLRPTYVSFKNRTGVCSTMAIFVTPGYIYTIVTDANRYSSFTGWWWGALMRVWNFPSAVDWGNGKICYPTEMGVRVSGY